MSTLLLGVLRERKEVGMKVMLISVIAFGARYNRNQGHFSPNNLCNLISHIPCIPAKETNTGV